MWNSKGAKGLISLGIPGLKRYMAAATNCGRGVMSIDGDDAMERRGTIRFDDMDGENLLAELILHIANMCEDDPTFGATKLNKILWWADFLSYARHGTPITGVEYQRIKNGPAPKRLVPIRNQLAANNDAAVQKRTYFKRIQNRVVPLRDADYSLFTGEQIALVDEMISGLWEDSATQVSEASHGKAWEIAKEGQSIPYESIFLSDNQTNSMDISETHALAERLDWKRS